jgi:hypothetical protein
MAALKNMRRGPEDSATAHGLGDILKGNDKKWWIVVQDKNGRYRWAPLKGEKPKIPVKKPQKPRSDKKSAIKKATPKVQPKATPMPKPSKEKIPDEHLEKLMILKMEVIVRPPTKVVGMDKIGVCYGYFELPESGKKIVASKYKNKLIEVPNSSAKGTERKGMQMYISKNHDDDWLWIPFKMPDQTPSAKAYYAQFYIEEGPWDPKPTILKLKTIKPALKAANIYFETVGWKGIYADIGEIHYAIYANVAEDKTFQKNHTKRDGMTEVSYFGISDFDYFNATRTCYLELRTDIKPSDVKIFKEVMFDTFGDKFVIKNGKIPKYYIEIWDKFKKK